MDEPKVSELQTSIKIIEQKIEVLQRSVDSSTTCSKQVMEYLLKINTELGQIKTDIKQHDKDIEGLGKKVSAMEQAFSDIQKTNLLFSKMVEDLQTDITEIKTSVQNITEAFQDSIKPSLKELGDFKGTVTKFIWAIITAIISLGIATVWGLVFKK